MMLLKALQRYLLQWCYRKLHHVKTTQVIQWLWLCVNNTWR